MCHYCRRSCLLWWIQSPWSDSLQISELGPNCACSKCVCHAMMVIQRRKTSCQCSQGICLPSFLPSAAFHRRIHRRHPAQVWGEQEHHGEPAEPRGLREGRLQTRRRAIAAHVMAPCVSPGAERLPAGSRSALHLLIWRCRFFIFYFKQTVSWCSNTHPCLQVTALSFCCYFLLF